MDPLYTVVDLLTLQYIFLLLVWDAVGCNTCQVGIFLLQDALLVLVVPDVLPCHRISVTEQAVASSLTQCLNTRFAG